MIEFELANGYIVALMPKASFNKLFFDKRTVAKTNLPIATAEIYIVIDNPDIYKKKS